MGDIADAVKYVVKNHMRKTVLETQSRLVLMDPLFSNAV